MKEVAQQISQLTRDDWTIMSNGGSIDVLGQPVTVDDIIVRREAKDDVVIETYEALVLALETELTPW